MYDFVYGRSRALHVLGAPPFFREFGARLNRRNFYLYL
jgi:hypothetical protein